MTRISNLQQLPEAVLLEIFSYLSKKELINVRHTSQQLNRICRLKYLNKMHFVFMPTRSVEEIVEFLTSLEGTQFSLDFYCIDLSRVFERTWKNLGASIVSLNLFHDCSLDLRTFRNVLVHCPNLRHLGIEVPKSQELINNPKKTLRFIERNCTVNENLVSFEIRGDISSNHWKILMTSMLAIFPKMKTLKFSGFMVKTPPVNQEQPDDFQLDKALNPIDLEVLLSFGNKITFRASRDRCIAFKIDEFRFLNRGEFQNIHVEMLKLLTEQQTLKILDAQLELFGPTSMQRQWSVEKEKELILRISKECPNIEEFRVNVQYEREAQPGGSRKLYLSHEEFTKILNSNLKHLELNFRLECAMRGCKPPTNGRIRTLVIRSPQHKQFVNVDQCFLISTHFIGLKHLEIGVITECGLNTIFHRLPSLECLKIVLNYRYSTSNSNDYQIVHQNCQNWRKLLTMRVENLKCFFIYFYDKHTILPSRFFADDELARECIFPALKHLCLAGKTNCYSWELVKNIAKNSPQLEILETEFPDRLYELPLICSRLKNLTYLKYDFVLKEMGKNMNNLFLNSSKLRYLCNDIQQFRFNRFTGEVYPFYISTQRPEQDFENYWNRLPLHECRCPFENGPFIKGNFYAAGSRTRRS